MKPDYIMFVFSILVSVWFVFYYMRKVHQYYGIEYFDKDLKNSDISLKRRTSWFILLMVLTGLMFYLKLNLVTISFMIIYMSIGVSVSVTDLSYHIIPDRYHFFGLGAGIAELMTHYMTGQPVAWLMIMINLFFVLFLYMTGMIYEKVRGLEGLGMGDIKLLIWMSVVLSDYFVYGFLIGILGALCMQFLIAIMKRKSTLGNAFALGPYLVFGMVIIRIFEQQVPVILK